MTAEIAILNKEGIALAADSAVTISASGGGAPKIFNSVNKLFSLSKYHPVGIMIYGSAQFMEYPWESLIKVFRRQLDRKRFDLLQGYADAFIDYLQSQNDVFDEELQARQFQKFVWNRFKRVHDELRVGLEALVTEHSTLSEEEIRKFIEAHIAQMVDEALALEHRHADSLKYERSLKSRYEPKVGDVLTHVFKELPLTTKARKKLISYACLIASRTPPSESIAGVVIAGFGEKQLFPAYAAYHVDMLIGDRLRYVIHDSDRISAHKTAIIRPFAQSESVSAFLQGHDPAYAEAVGGFVQGILSKHLTEYVVSLPQLSEKDKAQFKKHLEQKRASILKTLDVGMKEFVKQQFSGPIVQMVSFLPKDELAAMAESLVNLTSFKRHITPDAETVGGPIDVAVISKGDGFVWIKRKHYFDPKLNPQFFNNYYYEHKEAQ